MPPKNAHGWHSTPTLAHCFSAPCLPEPLSPNVTTSQVNVIAYVLIFLLARGRARSVTHSKKKRKKEGISNILCLALA